MEAIPLDLSGNWDSEPDFYSAVGESCKKYGFVKFVGHGIEAETIAEAFSWARQFFALSIDAKGVAGRPPGPGPNRGYAAIGKEKLAGISGYGKGVKAPKMVEDVKESFDLGPDSDARHPTPWPSEAEISGFRAFMSKFHGRCDDVHLRILRILQSALDLSDDRLLSLCEGGNAEVRISHYPAIDLQRLSTGNTFRIAEHTDTGTVTLLFQDSVGGLEIEDPLKPGQFLPVTTTDEVEMIVNIGDTLQRWTNGILRSANHRVVQPKSSEALSNGVAPERFSVAFFGKASPEALIRPLQEFHEAGQDSESEGNITAADYYSMLQTKTFPEGSEVDF